MPADRRCDKRDSARVADRCVTAGQRRVPQVSDPFRVRGVRNEYFATPDRPIGPVAGAVEDDAEHRHAGHESVLGHHRRDVGVVMLNLGDPVAVVRSRPPRRPVARVGVGGDDLRLDGVQVAELFDRGCRTPRASRGSPCRRCAGSSRHEFRWSDRSVFFSSPPTASTDGRAPADPSVDHRATRAGWARNLEPDESAAGPAQ